MVPFVHVHEFSDIVVSGKYDLYCEKIWQNFHIKTGNKINHHTNWVNLCLVKTG